MPSTLRTTQAALAAALLAAATGCLSSSNDVTGTGTTPIALLRIAQGVSDAANGVDVAVNGNAGLSAVPFGGIFSYAQVDAGAKYTFTATGGSGTPFYTQAAGTLAPNTAFTIVTYGRITSGATPAATGALLTDTTTAAAGTGVLVRVFNAVDYLTAGSGTPVDVYVYTRGTTRPTTPTVANLAYGTRSAYVASTVGALEVDVFAAGAASTGAPLFETTLTTASGSIRTFVLLDPVPTTSNQPTALPVGNVLVLNDQN